MKATSSMESIASQLIRESFGTKQFKSAVQEGISPTVLTFKIFPYLLDAYEEALKATKSKNKRYKRSSTVLGAHLETEVLPELKAGCSINEIDGILSEVYSAYPEIKTIIAQTEKDFPSNGNNGGIVYSIIGALVGAVCIYAVGYAIGYAFS